MMQARGSVAALFAATCCSVMLILSGCDSSDDTTKVAPPRDSGRSMEQATPATHITRTDTGPSPSTPDPAKPRAETSTRAPKAAPGKTIFMGQVIADDGQPLGTTVTVSLNSDPTISDFSNMAPGTSTAVAADGHYQFEADTPPFAQIYVTGKGLLPMATFADQAELSGSEPIVRNVNMQRALEISGRLVDADGSPLDGRVVATWPMDRSAPIYRAAKTVKVMPIGNAPSSAQNGFSVSVGPGEVHLIASAEGYGPVEKVTTAPASGIEIKLGEGGSIDGMVLMDGTREGISSATVGLTAINKPRVNQMTVPKASTVVTDPQGAFRLRGVAAGDYVLSAKGEKLFPVIKKGKQGSAQVRLEDGASTSGIELLLYPGHTLSGRVTHSETGEPIAGVKISQKNYGNEIKTETDADGRYRLFPVTNGQLIVDKEGYRIDDSSANRAASYYSNSPSASMVFLELGDELEATRDMKMAESITISGKVTRKNGDAIPDANVSLVTTGGPGRNFTAKVKHDGTYKIETLPNTNCRVKAVAPGYARGFSETVEVMDTSVTGVVVLLNMGGTMSGVVEDTKGKTVAGAEVSALGMVMIGNSGMGDQLGRATTDAEGRFVLLNMPSGPVTLKASMKGYASSANQKEEVEEGETRTDIRLTLRTPHYIAGRVTDKDKKPVVGANINFYSQDGSNGNASSDEDGKYRVEDLAEGTYSGHCWGGSGQSVQKQGVQVDRDDVDFVLGEEKKGDVTVIGHVLDWKSRDPIKDFKVTPTYNLLKMTPDKPGEFTFQAQANVSYTLTASAAGYQSTTQQFSAEGVGTTKEITFLLGPGGTIIGRVVNKADKSPIPGAKLKMMMASNYGGGWISDEMRASMRNATTTDDGQFIFEKVPAGSMQIEVKVGEGKAPAGKTISVEHDKIADAGDIEVGTGGAIRVKVVRDPGDSPVEGVEVVVYMQMSVGGSGQMTKKTDAQGIALFENLAPGSYAVSDSKRKIYNNTVLNGEATVDVVLRMGGGTLTGTISREGKPISAGGISLSRQGGKPGERTGSQAGVEGEGKYEIKNLPAGTYRATVYSYEQQASGRMTRAEETVEIRGSGVQVKDFELPSGHLVGLVTDEAGKPVPNAAISVVPLNPGSAYASMFSYGTTYQSGDKGEFDLVGMAAGEYTVSARKTGIGLSKPEKVEVPAQGKSRSITLKLEQGNAGSVVSTALNYTSGAPIPEAWCYLTSVDTGGRYDHSAKRGPDGVMTIPDIPVGRYRVEVGSWGFSTGNHDIEVKAGETVRLDDVLYDAGAVRLTVTGAGGAPVVGAQCTITPDDPASIEKPQSGTTDSTGLWVARGLFPGSYTATAKNSSGKTATAKMAIIAHEVIEVTVGVE